MKICIYGAGAVGGLVAGRLAQAGHDVSVVARGAQLTAIREKGLRIRSPEGKEQAVRIKADSDPSKLGRAGLRLRCGEGAEPARRRDGHRSAARRRIRPSSPR